MKIRIASTIGGAGFDLRLRLWDLTSKAINLRLFRLRGSVLTRGLRPNVAKAFPFARQVSTDLQILDAYATLRGLAASTRGR